MIWGLIFNTWLFTSLEYKVLRTANTYDWIIAIADSKTNNAICVIIKIVNKDVDTKGPYFPRILIDISEQIVWQQVM